LEGTEAWRTLRPGGLCGLAGSAAWRLGSFAASAAWRLCGLEGTEAWRALRLGGL
jgi:hypothetical protein